MKTVLLKKNKKKLQKVLIEIRFHLVKSFKVLLCLGQLCFPQVFLQSFSIMHLRKTTLLFISACSASIKNLQGLRKRSVTCRVLLNLEGSTDERDSLICCLELSSANSQETLSYESFLFCLLAHTFDLICWLSQSIIPILFFLLSLTQPSPGYICDLPGSSAPFYPITSCPVKIPAHSYFFFQRRNS